MKLPLKRLLAHTHYFLQEGSLSYNTRRNALVETLEPLTVSSFQPAAKKPLSVLDQHNPLQEDCATTCH